MDINIPYRRYTPKYSLDLKRPPSPTRYCGCTRTPDVLLSPRRRNLSNLSYMQAGKHTIESLRKYEENDLANVNSARYRLVDEY